MVCSQIRCPADALNQAFRAARGTLIGWLNADDLSPLGALARAVAALNAHPEWLMVGFPPRGFSAAWHWLQARAAEDSRIVLIAESLPREQLLALYGCCDVFLSLHRSEGFGRGMAEAL